MTGRSIRRPPPSAARIERLGEPSRLIDALRAEMFAAPDWLVAEEVRTSPGCPDSLRRADGIAVQLSRAAGWRIEALEVKLSRADLALELNEPDKIAPFALFCACVWIVVPAPRKNVISSLLDLPEMWGVLEVGTGGVEVVRAAVVRKNVEEPTPAFLKALLRSAGRPVEREARGEGDAPSRAIGGRLSKGFIWLDGCLHRQAAPLEKRWPATVPCWSCAEGLPAHPEAVAAALDGSDPAALARYREQIAGLLGVRSSPGPAVVSCPAGDLELAAAAGGGR